VAEQLSLFGEENTTYNTAMGHLLDLRFAPAMTAFTDYARFFPWGRVVDREIAMACYHRSLALDPEQFDRDHLLCTDLAQELRDFDLIEIRKTMKEIDGDLFLRHMEQIREEEAGGPGHAGSTPRFRRA